MDLKKKKKNSSLMTLAWCKKLLGSSFATVKLNQVTAVDKILLKLIDGQR